MANTFDPTEVASVAIELAKKDFVLSGLVFRDAENEYSRGTGHVAKVVIPGAGKAVVKDATDVLSAIPAQDLTEQTVSVTLKSVHARAVLSEADLSVGLTDYARQVVRPLTTPVVDAAEAAIGTVMNATTLNAGLAYTAATLLSKITAARASLIVNGLGVNETVHAVLGVNAYGLLLDTGVLDNAPATGAPKVRNVFIHESGRIADPDDVIVFTPRAFALAVRAPEVPASAPNGAKVQSTESGFGIRYLQTFDASTAAESALVSTFVGATALPLPVFDATNGGVDLVTGGGATRFTVAAAG